MMSRHCSSYGTVSVALDPWRSVPFATVAVVRIQEAIISTWALWKFDTCMRYVTQTVWQFSMFVEQRTLMEQGGR